MSLADMFFLNYNGPSITRIKKILGQREPLRAGEKTNAEAPRRKTYRHRK